MELLLNVFKSYLFSLKTRVIVNYEQFSIYLYIYIFIEINLH